MKKILFAVALLTAFAGTTVYAQTPEEPQVKATTTVEDAFKAMNAEDLPQAVKDALAAKFEGKKVTAAYVKEADGVRTFKVTVADAEGNASDVLFSENGEVLPTE